jgi:hypothetical protein
MTLPNETLLATSELPKSGMTIQELISKMLRSNERINIKTQQLRQCSGYPIDVY